MKIKLEHDNLILITADGYEFEIVDNNPGIEIIGVSGLIMHDGIVEGRLIVRHLSEVEKTENMGIEQIRAMIRL